MGLPGSGFWNFLARRYSKQPIRDEATYRRKLEETRLYFTPDSEVLEIGCGTGSTAILHAPYVRSISCIDFSEKMIDIAIERARAAHVQNITFDVADISALPDGDGPYDVVMAMSILHLLDDRVAVIEKVFDLLKPGGVFVSSTICLGDGAWPLRVLVRLLSPLGLLPTVNFFSEDTLKADLAEAGFAIERAWCPGPNSASFIVARRPG